MTSKKKVIKKRREEEEEGGKSGASGSSVEFRDFLSGKQESRDDLLSPEEKRRLLAVHQDVHEVKVKKQKELREDRKALKEGKASKSGLQQGMGAGMGSPYPPNPALADKAQFSGMDRQTNSLPTDYLGETNEGDKNKLENEYQKRYQPENAPKFHPKPEFK